MIKLCLGFCNMPTVIDYDLIKPYRVSEVSGAPAASAEPEIRFTIGRDDLCKTKIIIKSYISDNISDYLLRLIMALPKTAVTAIITADAPITEPHPLSFFGAAVVTSESPLSVGASVDGVSPVVTASVT